MAWTPAVSTSIVIDGLYTTRRTVMAMTRFGVDLAKSVFQVHGVDEDGVLIRKRLSRQKLSEFFATHSPSLIGMEACSGSALLGEAI